MDALGLLRIKVLRGFNLSVLDKVTGASDPYVVITTAGQKVKTRFLKKNCNPEWNDELTLPIKDLNAPISLTVYDKDTFSDDDSMGTAEIDIQPYVEAVRLRKSLGELPNGVALKKLQPSEKNDLADESCIILEDGRITQKMRLKLNNVESGEVLIQLEWVDIPGSKGLDPDY
ncbi:Gag-pro-like protein [Hibiscus syriacus]|uniref:Gag-pro-like protein n=1 Tax=Hibiscus syriacus TaxID=106335 RepID=A0A6A3CSC5_HIBSY|nr:protein C2-DOMAIN ABA-RELATED 9-like [Hibiscus syriacus]KAE8730089.1 Gag-pro-like protein [Hibiscus syriacus]